MSTTHAPARSRARHRADPLRSAHGRPAPPRQRVAAELDRIERMWLNRLAHAGEGVPGG